jgi:membrane protease YdiL (CAAX protease family)
MQLLNYVVREDWGELTQQMMRENVRLWRGLQVLAVLSALASLTALFLCPFRPGQDVCYTVLSSCLFIGFSLWTVLRADKDSILYAGLATLLLVGAAAVGGVLRPRLGREHDVIESLRAVGGGLAMLSSWAILAWSHDRRRTGLERLGVTTKGWAIDALLGGFVGAALGAHLTLAAHFAGLDRGPLPSWAVVVWQVSFWAGLRGLGEELLFRGLAFHVLRERLDRGFWPTAAWITMLNLLPYLATGSLNGSSRAWVLPYIAAMAAVNAVLREWRRSLVPCLACNVSFNAVLLVGLGYAV